MHKIIQKMTQYGPLVVGLVLSRIIPHPANFTPLSAAAVWSGAALEPRTAGIVIVVSMVISDLLLGFDSLPSRIAVYGSLLLTVIIGRVILRKRSVGRVITAAVTASLSFFVITNFSVWLFSDMYPRTFAGIISCYYMALPFLRNSAIADLMFSGIFVGAWEVVKKYNNQRMAVTE